MKRRPSPERIDALPCCRAYPTDLTDAQWAAIEPMIPDARPGGRPRKAGKRGFAPG